VPPHSILVAFVRLTIVAAAFLLPVVTSAWGAELDGVDLPATRQAVGKTLLLNGYGLRTYSILGIHIYVAGLYLEHLNTDPDAIIQSPETKLVSVRFKRDVSADSARDAWRTALNNNCVAPCVLDPDDVARFLALVPAMHAGDTYNLLFEGHRAVVTVNGQQIGTITHPMLADAVLATFIGPKPASPALKRGLLSGHA
jgi:hypothetical protein